MDSLLMAWNEFDGITDQELRQMIASIKQEIQDIYEDEDNWETVVTGYDFSEARYRTEDYMHVGAEYFISDLDVRIAKIEAELKRRADGEFIP